MVTIEKILYNEHKIRIRLDTGEDLPCPYSLLSQLSLSSGDILDSEGYRFLKDESSKFNCREAALRYLGIRQRSKMELRRYLKKKKFDEIHISAAMLFLEEKGYLDDLAFAEHYIISINNRKPAGKHLLKSKLYEKGITGKTADKAIKKSGLLEPDLNAITELAEKKYRQVQNKENAWERVYRFLASRGFDHDTIKKAMKPVFFEDPPE